MLGSKPDRMLSRMLECLFNCSRWMLVECLVECLIECLVECLIECSFECLVRYLVKWWFEAWSAAWSAVWLNVDFITCCLLIYLLICIVLLLSYLFCCFTHLLSHSFHSISFYFIAAARNTGPKLDQVLGWMLRRMPTNLSVDWMLTCILEASWSSYWMSNGEGWGNPLRAEAA
jgi:hypothetical protein